MIKPVITYFIYTLSHPYTDEVFYVGQSTRPEDRYYLHVVPLRTKSYLSKEKVSNVLQYCITNEIVPVCHVIDKIETTELTDAMRLEEYWLQQFRAWGFHMVNHFKVTPKLRIYQ